MPKRLLSGGGYLCYRNLTFAEERELDAMRGNQPSAPPAIPSRAYLAACSTPGGISVRIEGEAGPSRAPEHTCSDRVATSGPTELSSEAPLPSASQHVPSDH